jgi:hypothetical protein
MKRSEVVWSYDAARNANVATLVDSDGREWTASIRQELFSGHFRMATTLFCRFEGRNISNAAPPSLEAAQQ